MFGISRSAIWAFGVHILTASGAFLAFLSLVAAAEHDFVKCFFWLGVALIIDGVDGPLARKLEVKRWWPHWSGDMIDSVVDYSTYVLIPAFALYQSGLMGQYFSFAAGAIIVITSAIYYADTRMKTEDYGFKGFPVCWNMIVFTLFIVSPSELLSFAFVLITAVLTFVPVIFIHPVRVKILRNLSLAVFALWAFGGMTALALNVNTPHTLASPVWVDVVIAASGLYLFSIGFILQLLGKLK
ncbi:MAG TPA: phosphatidylcholine/phosphatidylserine synthase [Rhizobiaceae bacterium]|nr:phosphatidylcholine/phosphatidylserine synthase [Rhizobiaceae bacterium]